VTLNDKTTLTLRLIFDLIFYIAQFSVLVKNNKKVLCSKLLGFFPFFFLFLP